MSTSMQVQGTPVKAVTSAGTGTKASTPIKATTSAGSKISGSSSTPATKRQSTKASPKSSPKSSPTTPRTSTTPTPSATLSPRVSKGEGADEGGVGVPFKPKSSEQIVAELKRHVLEYVSQQDDDKKSEIVNAVVYDVIKLFASTPVIASEEFQLTNDRSLTRAQLAAGELAIMTGEVKDLLMVALYDSYKMMLTEITGTDSLSDVDTSAGEVDENAEIEAYQDPTTIQDDNGGHMRRAIQYVLRWVDSYKTLASERDVSISNDPQGLYAPYFILGASITMNYKPSSGNTLVADTKTYLAKAYREEYNADITEERYNDLIGTAITGESLLIVNALGQDAASSMAPRSKAQPKSGLPKSLTTKKETKEPVSPMSPAKPKTTTTTTSISTPQKVSSPTIKSPTVRTAQQPGPSSQGTPSIEEMLMTFEPSTEPKAETKTEIKTRVKTSPVQRGTTKPSAESTVIRYLGDDGYAKIKKVGELGNAIAMVNSGNEQLLPKLLEMVERNEYFKAISDNGFSAAVFKDLSTANLKAVADDAAVRGPILKFIRKLAYANDPPLRAYSAAVQQDTETLKKTLASLLANERVKDLMRDNGIEGPSVPGMMRSPKSLTSQPRR